jgi:hypothetical protein
MHPFLILTILLALLTACAPPTPALLAPDEILSRVVQRTRALKSFSFVVVRTGAPAYLDANQTISLSRLEGAYVAPDQAQGQARVIGPGIVASIKFISIGQHYWETNFLTGEWWECPLDACFNPAILFDSQSGLQPILETDLSGLQLLKNETLEELPGKQLYSLVGKLKGEHLFKVSWGMIGPQEINAHLWVDPDTFVLHRIQLEEPAVPGAEATLWTVDFLNFDKAGSIQPPTTPTPRP